MSPLMKRRAVSLFRENAPAGKVERFDPARAAPGGGANYRGQSSWVQFQDYSISRRRIFTENAVSKREQWLGVQTAVGEINRLRSVTPWYTIPDAASNVEEFLMGALLQ